MKAVHAVSLAAFTALVVLPVLLSAAALMEEFGNRLTH